MRNAAAALLVLAALVARFTHARTLKQASTPGSARRVLRRPDALLLLLLVTLLGLVNTRELRRSRRRAVPPALTAALHPAPPIQQGVPIIGQPATNPSTATDPWANFTRRFNRFYVAVDLLNSTTADSDEACAVICNDDPLCEFFSWCPSNTTGGCGIPAANATYSSIVPPGGCITSWDPEINRTAYFLAYGKAVPFISGSFVPQQSGSARRLLQADSVWTNFTYLQNRFDESIDLLGTITAASAEECARACNADERCDYWTRCPTEVGSAGCQVPSFTPNALPRTVPAGTCLLSNTDGPDLAAQILMVGKDVTFESGLWKQSADSPALSPAPAPDAGTIVIVPTIPGSSPQAPAGAGGTGNVLPAAAAGSVLNNTAWSYGFDNITCAIWNGIDWEDDPTTVVKASGSKNFSSSGFEAYQSEQCAAGDASGERLAADLLKGGEAAHFAFLVSVVECPDGSASLIAPLVEWITKNANSDTNFVIKYAWAWVQAGNELGVAGCVSIGQIDEQTGKVTVVNVKP